MGVEAQRHVAERGEFLVDAVDRWARALLDALDKGDRLGLVVPPSSREPQSKQGMVLVDKELQRRFRIWAARLSTPDQRVNAKDLLALAMAEGLAADKRRPAPKAPPPAWVSGSTKAVALPAELVDALKPLAKARGTSVVSLTDRVMRIIVAQPQVLDALDLPGAEVEASPEAHEAAARAVELAGGPVEPIEPEAEAPRRRRSAKRRPAPRSRA